MGQRSTRGYCRVPLRQGTSSSTKKDIFCLFVCLCVCLFVCSFVCLFFCLFVLLFVCSFVCLFFCLFVRSFVQSVGRSVGRLVGCSLVLFCVFYEDDMISKFKYYWPPGAVSLTSVLIGVFVIIFVTKGNSIHSINLIRQNHDFSH